MNDLSSMYARATSPFDKLRRVDADGEYWLARDLMSPLGYERWERFSDSIDRAKLSAEASGIDSSGMFSQVAQLRSAGNLGMIEASDYRLTRYAAYLVAMNGDVRKPEIASAQQYFAIRAREAELNQKPKTRVEIARALLATEEALEAAELARLEAEAARRALEPAANAWTTLASSEGDLSFADASKVLSRDHGISLGQNRLFAILAAWGWIYRARSDNGWRAYQSYVDCGYLAEKIQSHTHPRTGEIIIDPPQVRIRPKGMARILKQCGAVPNMAELTTGPHTD
jgi:phage antirepressor YoqD-like protein